MTKNARFLRDTRFRRALRGYSPTDVRRVVDHAVASYQDALAEIQRLRAEHTDVMRQLLEAQNHEREATRILSRAECEAQAIRDTATHRAEAILTEAEHHALALVRDAEGRRAQIGAFGERCRARRAKTIQRLEEELAELSALPSGAVPNAQVTTPEPLAPIASAPAAAEQSADVAGPTPVYVAAAGRTVQPRRATSLLEPVPQQAQRSEPPVYLEDRRHVPAEFDSAARQRIRPPAPGKTRSWTNVLNGSYRPLVPAGLAAAAVLSVLALPRVDLAAVIAAQRPTPAASMQPSSQDRAANTAVPLSVSTQVAPGASKALQVRLEATGDCWVRVAADGQAVSKLLTRGDVLTTESDGPIGLRAGDGSAVRVSVNGQELPALGRAGQVVNRAFTPPAR